MTLGNVWRPLYTIHYRPKSSCYCLVAQSWLSRTISREHEGVVWLSLTDRHNHTRHDILQYRHATVNRRSGGWLWRSFHPPHLVARTSVAWPSVAGHQTRPKSGVRDCVLRVRFFVRSTRAFRVIVIDEHQQDRISNSPLDLIDAMSTSTHHHR